MLKRSHLSSDSVDQVSTTLKILERATPWKNRAELYVGLLKEVVRKCMRESNYLMILWDYEIEHRDRNHKVVRRPLFQTQDKTPHDYTFDNQSDISIICNFG